MSIHWKSLDELPEFKSGGLEMAGIDAPFSHVKQHGHPNSRVVELVHTIEKKFDQFANGAQVVDDYLACCFRPAEAFSWPPLQGRLDPEVLKVLFALLDLGTVQQPSTRRF